MYLKKSLILLPLLMLSSCGTKTSSVPVVTIPGSSITTNTTSSPYSTSTTEKKTFEEVFSQLQQGYFFEGTVSKYQFYDDGTSAEYHAPMQVVSNKSSYQAVKWNYGAKDAQASKENGLASNVTYVSQEKDGKKYIVSQYLDMNNEVVNSYMADSKNQLATWDSALFGDCFQYFSTDDFLEDGLGNYELDLENSDLLNGYVALARQIYGKIALTPDSFTLTFSESMEELSFLMVYKDEDLYGQGTGHIEVEGTFTTLGGNVAIDPIKPIEGKEDAIFKGAMDKLQQHNYQISTKYNETDFGDNIVDTHEGYATKDQLVYTFKYKDETSNDNYMYYKKDDSHIQGAELLQGSYYQDREPIQGTIEDLYPSFNISSLLFDYNNKSDTYTLKKDLPITLRIEDASEMSTFYKSSPVTDIRVKIKSDSVNFVIATEAGRTIDITYSNIGKVENKVSVSTIQSDVSALKWPQLLERFPSYLKDAENKLGSLEVLNNVPTLGGTYSKVMVDNAIGGKTGNIDLRVDFQDLETTQKIRDQYVQKAKKDGYVVDKTQADREGFTFLTKTVKINNVDKIINLKIWIYQAYFGGYRLYIAVTSPKASNN